MSNNEQKRNKEYVYVAYDGKYTKIGKSKNPEKRIKDLQTANPNLILVGYGNFTTEYHIHKLFYNYRVKGEFFRLDKKQREKLLQFITGEINSLDDKWIKKMRQKSSKKRRDESEKQKMSNFVIPFGKYKGQKVREIYDIDYIAWVVRSFNNDKIVRIFKSRLNELSKCKPERFYQNKVND